jgi:predicted dehydrogenase
MEIPGGKIWYQQGERSWWEPIAHKTYEVRHEDPLDAQISHFCDVIADKAAPLVSGRDGLKSLQVIEAIKASAGTGGIVRIGEAG